MRKYMILMFFTVLTLLSSTGMDTIPPQVEARAKLKTDSQLASISEPLGKDRWVVHFDRLRRHIDSINAMNMVVRDSFIQAATQRDSIMIAMISIIAENTRLREENTQYRKDCQLISKAPDYLFYFTLVFISSLFSHGAFEGWKKWRDKNKNV